MLNTLGATAGEDFTHLATHDIKNKLPADLVAFWEVTEQSGMDIIAADGHPLGQTFKFKVDVSRNPDYVRFFEGVQQEPLYSDIMISLSALSHDNTVIVTIEPKSLITL